jgi:hypothetical protein
VEVRSLDSIYCLVKWLSVGVGGVIGGKSRRSEFERQRPLSTHCSHLGLKYQKLLRA